MRATRTKSGHFERTPPTSTAKRNEMNHASSDVIAFPAPDAGTVSPEGESPFLVFGSPLIEPAEIDEVIDCLHSGWLGTGPKVAKFEQDFAHYKGVDQAVALNSCTAALHLSLIAAGVGPGDEVITTPLTFCASINAIIHAGATPVLADVDPITMNLDPARVESKISSKTKAILPVHFAGRPCATRRNDGRLRLLQLLRHQERGDR
jgi:hypothetical protein